MLLINVKRILRKVKNYLLDIWYSGKNLQDLSMSGIEGAFAGHASDYIVMQAIFAHIPVSKKDRFVDIGCGKGRVLLYVSKKFKPVSITGYELNKSSSDIAKGIGDSVGFSVINNNIFNEFPDYGTYFYLFNPFEKRVLKKFLSLMADTSFRVIIYYNPPELTEEDIYFITQVLRLELQARRVSNWMLPPLPRSVRYLIITRQSSTSSVPL